MARAQKDLARAFGYFAGFLMFSAISDKYRRSGSKDGDRRALSGESSAFAISLSLHAALAIGFYFSIGFGREAPKEDPISTSMNVSLVPGDGLTVSLPKTMAEQVQKPETKPETKPEPTPDPEPISEPEPQETVEQEDVPSPTDQAAAPLTGTSEGPPSSTIGGRGMIWTPPAPRPQGSGIDSDAEERLEQRVMMPEVEISKGASGAMLLSYDQGRFSDAVSAKEALRLKGAGTIMMAIQVFKDGTVGDCVVTVSSGSTTLDERGCDLVKSYVYRPAQDEKGRTHESIVTEVLEWAKDGEFQSASGAGELQEEIDKMPQVVMPKTK